MFKKNRAELRRERKKRDILSPVNLLNLSKYTIYTNFSNKCLFPVKGPERIASARDQATRGAWGIAAPGPGLTAGPELTIFCQKSCKSIVYCIRLVCVFFYDEGRKHISLWTTKDVTI